MAESEQRPATEADDAAFAEGPAPAVGTPGPADLEAAIRAATRDAQLRAAAEVDNIRKRAQRDIENAQRYALERFAGELLAVRDSLELAVANTGAADARSVAAGQQATLQLLQKAFEKFSIQQIRPEGAVFDPALHEAVMNQPTTAVPPGTITEVMQSGYQLNGRLLRPARVVVAKAPDA
jgi:molecular chaperone GrpE